MLEVLDKELTIPEFWIGAAVLGAIGFLAGRWRWWAAIPLFLSVAICAGVGWTEWTDPYVGPAIRLEAGATYPYHLIASALLATGLTVAGVGSRRRRRIEPDA